MMFLTVEQWTLLTAAASPLIYGIGAGVWELARRRRPAAPTQTDHILHAAAREDEYVRRLKETR